MTTINLGLYSCKENRSQAEKKYSIYVLGKDGQEYILQTENLNEGALFPERQGVPLDTRLINRSMIVKDGAYYHLNHKTAIFSKYRLTGNNFEEVATADLKGFAIENFKWLGKDTLLLIGLDDQKLAQVEYRTILTNDMRIADQGNIGIPNPTGKFDSMSIGFVERRQNNLLLGYTYHQQLGGTAYTTSDTMYVTAVKYPKMQVLKTDKDMRSTYPGGTNTIQSYSFTDENQNYYFMSCPGIALGNRPDMPTGIFRINAGQQQPDKQYFFDISGSIISNHAYGIWYIGHHKAIIRSERKDLFKGLNDHYSTAHFEFYVLDLLQKKVVQKLDLPLDKGTRRECVVVNGDTAYIAVNSSTKGNFIWLYNIPQNTLKKGLELAGNTDFIMRIDQLKK
jgi:hypothetical protein